MYVVLNRPLSGTKQRIVGGGVSTSGGYTYHTFTSSGSFYVTSGNESNLNPKYQIEWIAVGGGGGGGRTNTANRPRAA